MGNVISFCSGKGGVGKTTLVANLGCLIAQNHRKTLLIDGDWNLGKLNISLGAKSFATWDGILSKSYSLKEAIQQLDDNLFFIASPSGKLGLEEMTPDLRSQIFFELEGVIKDYDHILFDHSSGINLSVLDFAAASQQHVIVTTPEPTSYTDAYAIMKLLSRKYAVKEFLLLVMMSREQMQTQGVMDRFLSVVYQQLNVKVNLMGIIPWDARFSEAIFKRNAFVNMFPSDPLTYQLRKISEAILEQDVQIKTGLQFSSEAYAYKEAI
jgi:flagellar biosynthesis protein FlhG